MQHGREPCRNRERDDGGGLWPAAALYGAAEDAAQHLGVLKAQQCDTLLRLAEMALAVAVVMLDSGRICGSDFDF